MKVLMLGWELPPHNSGGLGVACLNMARALSRQGADIDFLLPYSAEYPEIDFMHIVSTSEIGPFNHYGITAYESGKIEQKIISSSLSQQVSIRDLQHTYCDYLARHHDDFHPDVVHAHDWLTFEAGMSAKKDYNVPFVAHVHATEYDRAGGHRGNSLIHEIEHDGLMMADEIIAVSESTKRIIHEKYQIPLRKIDVVYNSLDDDFIKSKYVFCEDAYGYLKSLKSDGYTIVSTVGRLTLQKGLDNLLRAATLAIRENPKLMFVLAGDGEERNHLISLAAKLGISSNVLFTGFIRGRKLRDIYSVSDIFIMSSISEPFGLTALEAAHHGDALILTNQSGVSEIIWSAMKYDFWDTRKLADEILAIASSPALKSALQNNVRREYHQFSWNDVAKKCLQVYNNSINHKRYFH